MLEHKKVSLDFIAECQHAGGSLSVLSEIFSPNCLYKSVTGKLESLESYQQAIKEWFHAFPDFRTKLNKIETYGNVVFCDVIYLATHLNRYIETFRKDDLAFQSDFSRKFEKLDPVGTQVTQPAELILVFEKSKIVKFLIQEDTSRMYAQLGIKPFKPCASELEKKDDSFLRNLINRKLKIPLSRREIECLAPILSGFSAKYAAEQFSISYRTVERHLSNAYQKIGCHGKQQCIEFFYEESLLSVWHELSAFLLRKSVTS